MKPIILNATSPHEVPIDRKTGAMVWQAFKKKGTNHSSRAATLPYIMRRCEREGVAYLLRAHPGQGYWIEPIIEGGVDPFKPNKRGKLCRTR